MVSATATLPVELRRRAEQARTFLSRISIRLLAFNVLLVFLPAAGLLTLDTYERQMLRAQEQAMVQQGRVLAAALANPDGIDPLQADAILRDLRQRQQARLRVVDADGRLVADSSRLPVVSRQSSVVGQVEADDRRLTTDDRRPNDSGPPQSWLYWLGALPFRLSRVAPAPHRSGPESAEYHS